MSLIQKGNLVVDSGTIYIEQSTTKIHVEHNLGGVPDFAAIWIDLDDADDIP